MITVPSESLTLSAIRRAVTSIGPPGAYGTMMRVTFDWAEAVSAVKPVKTRPTSANKDTRRAIEFCDR